MTIQQQPHSISLSGNMLPFIINSGALVNFTLKDGANTLIESTYEPDSSGRIEIDVKDIIQSRLKYQIKGNAFYEQTEIVKQFTATIDSTTVNFKVIRCGVLDLADTPTNWLKGNFLTWQPQQKAITYYSPEWLTYYATEGCTIKLKAYFPESIVQNVTLGTCGSGKAFSFNLQYAHVAGLLGNKYPTHYDVWAETSAGARLSFIQRYYFSEVDSEQEQWFLFENSLGGLDTLRASGETDLESTHEHKTAIVDGEVQEYKIDTKRIYTKNTGHLTDYERRWLMDFPPARAKYIHHSGAIRKIVVTETDFRYSVSDSPTDYTFKYRFVSQSSCLNLTRSEHLIPSSITVPDIDAPGFFLPPRLSEYPRTPLHEGVILPAFDPHTDAASVTTVGAILSALLFEVIEKVSAGEAGGELVNILRSTSGGEPSDYSVFSSLRASNEIRIAIDEVLADIDFSDKYLSKVDPDTANGLIKFMQGIEVGNYIKGLLGTGGSIDQHGHAELTSLTLRRFLEVPELRYNKVQVYTGIRWDTFGAGIISGVEIDKDAEGNELQSGTITLKLEDSEFGAIAVDDMCQGIFHNFNGANDTANEDQKNGNFKFAGFSTSYFRITEILDGSNSQFRYVLRGVSERWTQQNHPKPFMHFACYANPSNPDRQSSTYTTTDYTIRLKNMTTWEYGAANIYEISGKLDGFTIGETVLEGEGQAFGNAYIWGTLQKVYNDPVRMEINNGGDGFLALGENMTITCNVMRGWEDITDTVETWSVTRETGNQVEDTAWNISHTNFNGTLEITHTKQYTDLGSGLSTLFVFTAKTGDNIASFHLTI